MANLPPNLPDLAATAIVRQAEDKKRADEIAKRAAADQKRRREDAIRAATLAKGNPGTSKG